nr:MAG TPA: hypothetical protein [Microviridae sp.]
MIKVVNAKQNSKNYANGPEIIVLRISAPHYLT